MKTEQKNGLIQYYTAIANSLSIPVIMYNVPSRTGVNIEPETCFELSKVPNIVAIKEASGNISQVDGIASFCHDNLFIYSGNDDQVLPILSLGGIGVISVLSNVKPLETHNMVWNFLNGNLSIARDIQLDLLPLISALFSEVNPIPVKKAMNLLGKCTDGIRRPLTVMEDANVEKLRNAMMNYGILSQNNDSESSLNARLTREASESNIR